MGRLTTHVLDTASGQPARGMRVDLCSPGRAAALASVRTDDEGRCPALLQNDTFAAGRYELRFHVGDYFRARGTVLPDPPFLEIVVVAFGIADAAAHYHVPLLVSPWSYSTYRGS